jgi:hypothetical protein
MTVSNELIDQLLAGYKKPEDLIGENGLLKQLTKRLVERALEAAKHPLREEKREAASYPKASLANIKKDNKVEFILKNTFDIYGADPFWPHPSACLSDWDESPTFGIRRDFRHNFQHEPRRPLPRQPPTPLAP